MKTPSKRKALLDGFVKNQIHQFIWFFSNDDSPPLLIILVALMVMRSMLVIVVHLHNPDALTGPMFWIFMGTPFKVLNSSPLHSELMASFWGVNALTLYTCFTHVEYIRSHFIRLNCLINSILFDDKLDDKTTAMVHNVPLKRMRAKSKVVLTLAFTFNFFMASCVTFVALMITFIVFLPYDIYLFLFSLFFWTTVWTCYTFECAFYAYYFLAYFISFAYLVRAILNKHWITFSPKHGQALTISNLSQIYSIVVPLLGDYRPLWSIYLSIAMVLSNALVCFNSYLFFFSDSPYYLQIVFNATSVTAFNIFFYGTYFAARVYVKNLSNLPVLSSLISRRKIGGRFRNLMLLECMEGENVGFVYINGKFITMMTLNSVISYLVTLFILYVSM